MLAVSIMSISTASGPKNFVIPRHGELASDTSADVSSRMQ